MYFVTDVRGVKFTQAGLSAASFLCAVTIPAVTGALRSGLSGDMCFLSPYLQPLSSKLTVSNDE